MDEVIAIVQARMQSSRLTGKILADLKGKPLIAHIIERLKASKGVDRVVLAVPESEAVYLAAVAAEAGAEIHSGSCDDVLGRFYSAARNFPAAYHVRATGDNPLIDTRMLARCIKECKSGLWDMVSCKNMPLGTNTEVFPAGLLDYLSSFGRLSYHREHVTTYVYEHEDEFRVRRLTPPRKLQAPQYRLTVDTPEDLSLMHIIYNNLYKAGKIIALEDVIRFLHKNPEIARINSHVTQRSWKDEKAATAVA